MSEKQYATCIEVIYPILTPFHWSSFDEKTSGNADMKLSSTIYDAFPISKAECLVQCVLHTLLRVLYILPMRMINKEYSES